MWPPNSSDLNPVDYATRGPLQQWSTIVKVSSQLTNWNERLSRHDRNYCNRWSTRVNGIVVCSSATACRHIELMFNWHVNVDFVYLFCLWVWFVRLFDVIKEQTIAIRHLLLLLSFARRCHFIFQSWLTNKLRINVKNKMTLIDAKFDADLINISKVTSRKTKWLRFLGLLCSLCCKFWHVFRLGLY